MAEDAKLIDFCEVTGCDPDQAQKYLQSTGWNLQEATAMFFEGVAPTAGSGNGSGGGGFGAPAGGAGDFDEDGVRAADEARVDQLVAAPVGLMSQAGNVRAVLRSELADYAAARKAKGGARNIRAATALAHLQPPVELIYNEPLDTAIEAARVQGRWLLVNIQNGEFVCMELNRDVWWKEDIQAAVTADFLFWQQYTTIRVESKVEDGYGGGGGGRGSSRGGGGGGGQRTVVREVDNEQAMAFLARYKLGLECPLIAIVDPRAGELVYTHVGPMTTTRMMELLSDWTTRHSLFDHDDVIERVDEVTPFEDRSAPPRGGASAGTAARRAATQGVSGGMAAAGGGAASVRRPRNAHLDEEASLKAAIEESLSDKGEALAGSSSSSASSSSSSSGKRGTTGAKTAASTSSSSSSSAAAAAAAADEADIVVIDDDEDGTGGGEQEGEDGTGSSGAAATRKPAGPPAALPVVRGRREAATGDGAEEDEAGSGAGSGSDSDVSFQYDDDDDASGGVVVTGGRSSLPKWTPPPPRTTTAAKPSTSSSAVARGSGSADASAVSGTKRPRPAGEGAGGGASADIISSSSSRVSVGSTAAETVEPPAAKRAKTVEAAPSAAASVAGAGVGGASLASQPPPSLAEIIAEPLAGAPMARLQVRLPDGSRIGRAFSPDAPVAAAFHWVAAATQRPHALAAAFAAALVTAGVAVGGALEGEAAARASAALQDIIAPAAAAGGGGEGGLPPHKWDLLKPTGAQRALSGVASSSFKAAGLTAAMLHLAEC